MPPETATEIAIAGVFAALFLIVTRPKLPERADIWRFLTGGIVFIALTAWGVRVTGVLVFGLLSIAGQLLASLVLDLASSRDLVGPQLIVGLAITLLAAVAAGVGPMITARRSR